MASRRFSLRSVNMSRFVIPTLLLGVYVLWMYDRSHREASPGSGALLYRLNSGKKPYTQFQQLQTQQTAGLSDEELSLEAAQHEGSRKVAAGARAAFATVDSGQALVADPSMARISVQGTSVGEAGGASAVGNDVGSAESGSKEDDSAWRLAAVREAMNHSWAGYTQYAWGFDELLPGSKSGENTFCGLGATIIDSLDSLWLMGMKGEFARARDWVANELSLDRQCSTSLFEIVIRDVGGLLAAHDLSGDPIFLTKAREFVDRMMSSFNTTTGIPRGSVNLGANTTMGTTWAGDHSAVLSELGTIQLEFIHLSQVSGEGKYGEAAERVVKYLHDHFDQGLLPIYIDYDTGALGVAMYTMGAMGDSYYEYLLKVWLLKGKADDMYRAMWVRAMDEMVAVLVRYSDEGYAYVADLKGSVLDARMEHLTCFVAGNLALGAHSGAVNGSKADEFLALAQNLTHTCYQMYRQMPTGLSPEFVSFASGRLVKGTAASNVLRPEAVESIFMLWRITGDPMYRDWGWEIFKAFDEYSKVASGGYSGLLDVGAVPPMQNNKMETFWLAETLKYLYLLFSPTSTIPLDKYVFNTEAHPLRIPAPAGAGGTFAASPDSILS